jgi:hypothetical protein
MSISTLVNAIDNLAKEKSPNMFPLHVHKIISGVQEIGRLSLPKSQIRAY